MKEKQKPYRIFAAYDSETCNVVDGLNKPFAFPVTHQIGIFDSTKSYKEITSDNVFNLIEINIFRHSCEVFNFFDFLISTLETADFIPVVMVHNLSFDMWALSPFFSSHKCEVLAKSATKPITIKIMNEDDPKAPSLVFWDTLGFFGKPLKTMGEECGIKKLVGEWDYNLIRTPETPLTDSEIEYALHDIYILFAYLGFYCRANTDIGEDDYAYRVTTKTGAVRAKRQAAFYKSKGISLKNNAGQYWFQNNKNERPKTDDELFTMQASTRGGFVFCAQNNANRCFELDNSDSVVVGIDATSQHPAQMISHYYPIGFTLEPKKSLELSLKLIDLVGVDELLDNWYKPFTVAFYGAFTFTNIKLKTNSIFERDGIAPLTSSRFSKSKKYEEESESSQVFAIEAAARGYCDTAIKPVFSFGKLMKAEQITIYITELEYWIIRQVYEFDSVEPVSGYGTCRFTRPTDFSVLSVFKFFKDKQLFKKALNIYEKAENYDYAQLKGICPDSLIAEMENGTADKNTINAQYMFLKSNLNALFGIEATNEAKPGYTIQRDGITVNPSLGLKDLPSKSKVWYQFGQRIVGWSRIAQIVHMLKIEPFVTTFINGDTDSLKFVCKKQNKSKIETILDFCGEKIYQAKEWVCDRVKREYPSKYIDTGRMGQYELEFETTKFCAGWNKSYVFMNENKRTNRLEFNITMAGIPAMSKIYMPSGEIIDHSLSEFCNNLFHEQKYTFEQITNIILGFNTTIDPTITGLCNRFTMPWATKFNGEITDYRGKTYKVSEPYAMALASMPKECNSYSNGDNFINMRYSIANNASVNTTPVILAWDIGGKPRIIEV